MKIQITLVPVTSRYQTFQRVKTTTTTTTTATLPTALAAFIAITHKAIANVANALVSGVTRSIKAINHAMTLMNVNLEHMIVNTRVSTQMEVTSARV